MAYFPLLSEPQKSRPKADSSSFTDTGRYVSIHSPKADLNFITVIHKQNGLLNDSGCYDLLCSAYGHSHTR